MRIPRQGVVVPALNTSSIAMSFLNSTGLYDMYRADIPLTAAQTRNTYIDLISGDGDDVVVDAFRSVNLFTACAS